jgi:methyl halide transferase
MIMTDWENRYRQNDTGWDKGEAAPPLVDYLRLHSIQGHVLVPGCGRGHDALALAHQGAQVTGLDVAPSALTEAQKKNPHAHISYEQGDFFQLPFPWHNRFDWLFEHTCFCAIDPSQRTAYALSATLALRPGGHIFAIFYLNPSHASGPPFPSSRKELDHLFQPSFDLREEWVPTRTFPGRENRELVRLYQKR